MPKMKTSRAAAKRFKKTGTGQLKRNKAYKSHILTKKSAPLTSSTNPIITPIIAKIILFILSQYHIFSLFTNITHSCCKFINTPAFLLRDA